MQITTLQKSLMFTAAISLAAMSLAACSDDDHEQDIPVSEIPASIIKEVQTSLPGIAVDEAEKETKDETVIYELEGNMTDGRRYEIKIREDGTILEIELEDEPDNEHEDAQEKTSTK